MTRFCKQVFYHLLVAGMLLPAAFAASKESPHDMLAKSFQQANLWNQGPVKLTAKVRLPKGDGTDINLEYALSWVGPEKWRAEWTANGFDQVTVLNNGKMSYVSNQPRQLVQLIQLEMAVAALDAGNPAGPYAVPPLDWEKAKIESTKKKVGTIDAKCLAFGDPMQTYCIDPATYHVLTVSSTVATAEIGSFEYNDYATVGTTAYPQSIKVNYAKTLLEEAKITVSRTEKFDDKTFAPPDKSTSVDWPSCADVDKNFAAPHVTKSVPAKEPDAALKAKKFGLVWVLASVGKDGSVTKATLIGGDPDLATAATDAVQGYKYSPYMRCGQPVQFQEVVVVPFAPPAQKKPQDDVYEH
jgi:hypothetical protein